MVTLLNKLEYIENVLLKRIYSMSLRLCLRSTENVQYGKPISHIKESFQRKC